MSSFACEYVRLDDVLVHPNADALELAQIGGYRAVVQKGLHKKGDLICYIPEDAVLPQWLVDQLGFTGKLAGSKKNRVKAIKLRGELSQGLVIPAKEIEGIIRSTGKFDYCAHEGNDVAAHLDIEKYEEPIPVEMSGRMRNRPDWFPRYTDIENIKKYNRALEEGEEVVITEKIHGTSFACGLHRDNMDEMLVSSRNVVLLEDEGNLYWRAAKQAGFHEDLKALLNALPQTETIVFFGEVFGAGVQDLAYGVPQGQIQVRLFDIMIDGRYVDHAEFMEIVGAEADWKGSDEEGNSIFEFTSEIPMVPILYRGPWRDGIEDLYARDNDTLSGTNVREGVVIRPIHERSSGKLGRVVLKAISEAYLLRKGGTERK